MDMPEKEYEDQLEQEPPVVINKWDMNAVKIALDDAVKKSLVDKYDYTERYGLIDGRLAISALAVGCSLFGLLWDWFYKFPASKTVLIICVVAYFSLIMCLQLYGSYVEGCTFYVAVDEDPTGKSPDRIWSVSSRMERYEDQYELELKVSEGGKDAGTGSIQRAITDWVDDQGEIQQDLIDREVLKLHDSLLKSKKKN